MKKRMLIRFIAFLAMLLIPFISLREELHDVPEKQYPDASPQDEITENSTVSESGTFRILDTDSGKIITLSDKEFCLGALVYEMPPYYEPEALKAQCIACYTHFCRLRRKQKESPDSELKGADFKADLSQNQFYISDETFREQCGGLYEEYSKKIRSAVDDVFGMTLTDENGEMIDAAYFAVSSGRTENSSDIFGFESPYLQAVPSPFDLTAADCITQVSFSEDDFISRLNTIDTDSDLTGKTIGKSECTASGSVKNITIGTNSYSGQDIRQAFSLRSTNFTLVQKGSLYTFTVKGYGHGVGMSQYGANEMAKQGMSFKEILNHYYGKANISAGHS